VKIWFEGLPQPIPARAESVGDSQLLTVELPYLRRNTQVFISDVDGDSSKGYMTEVSLVAGPEPRLQILVQTGEPAFEPISEIPLMSPHSTDGLEPVEVTEDPNRGSAALSLDDRTSTIPLLTPLQEALQEAPDEEPATPEALDQPSLQQRDRRVHSRRHSDVITRLPAPPQELEKPPARRWIWFGVLALAALCGGALYFHGELQQRTIGVAEAAPVPHRPAVDPVRVQPAEPPAEPPAEEPTVKARQPESTQPQPRPPVDRGAPRVWLGEQPTLVIPMEGSTKDARTYLMAKPAGIVINLPAARINGLKGVYKFEEGGFRQLNVRARDGGVQLMLFFNGPVPAYKLHFDPDAVRFTVVSR